MRPLLLKSFAGTSQDDALAKATIELNTIREKRGLVAVEAVWHLKEPPELWVAFGQPQSPYDRLWIDKEQVSPSVLAIAQPFRLDVFERQAAVVVRVYPGRTQEDAAVLFQREASEAASMGYVPVSQSWSDGRPGLGRILAVGMYASALRPAGTLTVTYQRASQPVTEETKVHSVKVCPMCAEQVQAEARLCRYCRYEFP